MQRIKASSLKSITTASSVGFLPLFSVLKRLLDVPLALRLHTSSSRIKLQIPLKVSLSPPAELLIIVIIQDQLSGVDGNSRNARTSSSDLPTDESSKPCWQLKVSQIY